MKMETLAPASFKSSFSAQTTKKGEPVELICDAYGEKPITITWSRDRTSFIPESEPRYETIKLEREERLSVILKIKYTDRRDSALFTCSASNAFGRDEYNIQVSLRVKLFVTINRIISWTYARSS